MVERERLSALMDGEFEEGESAGHWKRVGSDSELMDCWHVYHLIGDVMRGDRPVSADFASRVREALEGEPTVLAPRRQTSRTLKRVRLYALSAAATVAGVAVVGWLAVQNGPLGDSVGGARLADANAPVPTQTAAVVPVADQQVDDPEVDDYLRVHQEYSPTAVMHGVASYVRTVSTGR
ncbi:MAG: anti-sigma 24 factor [Betaproteobacteria bacterium]|nr:anti-sigma 24 factor [Betaproteobacteria bacterium]